MTDITTDPVVPAPEAAPVAPVVEAAPAADPYDSPETTTFDRGYVERLRRESEGYRTKAQQVEERWKPWGETLTGFEDAEQAAARELLVAIRDGDMNAVDTILGRTQDQAAPVAEPGTLTAADVAKMLDEREAKAATAAQIRAVEDDARKLGYKPDATKGSDEWLAYSQLVALAHARTNGDLNAAHAAVEAQRQAHVDAYLAAKAGAGTTPGPGTSQAPSGERDLTNWTMEDARKAATARLNARQVG